MVNKNRIMHQEWKEIGKTRCRKIQNKRERERKERERKEREREKREREREVFCSIASLSFEHTPSYSTHT